MLVEQAIVDAVGGAMRRNRLDATAGDLVSVILRSGAVSVRPPVDAPLDASLARVIDRADRAAQARQEITDLADVLESVLDECADTLAAFPAARTTIETALTEARGRARFATVVDECRATFWRVETTRASGRRQNQYFTTAAQAERESAGLPMTGDGIQHTARGVTAEDENDPVMTRRVVPPGGV